MEYYTPVSQVKHYEPPQAAAKTSGKKKKLRVHVDSNALGELLYLFNNCCWTKISVLSAGELAVIKSPLLRSMPLLDRNL